MTHKLLALAQFIVRSNNAFSDLLGVLLGMVLFGCLLLAMRSKAKKHGEIL
jgi:hypothetical protein